MGIWVGWFGLFSWGVSGCLVGWFVVNVGLILRFSVLCSGYGFEFSVTLWVSLLFVGVFDGHRLGFVIALLVVVILVVGLWFGGF